MRGHRTDDQSILLMMDAAQLSNTLQVHQNLAFVQAQLHRREQGLASSQGDRPFASQQV